MTLEERKAARFKYLNHLYECVEGHSNCCCSMFEVGKEVGFDEAMVDYLITYLQNEGLLEIRMTGPDGPMVGITHQGVREVERALSQPDQPTRYFPPAMNVIHIGHMVNSTIQQAGHGAEQSVGVDRSEADLIRAILEDIERIKSDLVLDVDSRAELEVEIATVDAQTRSPKPKRIIIKEGLASLRKILESASGNLAATGVKAVLASIVKYLAS